MGKQLIIIGAAGTFSLDRIHEIAAALNRAGLQIHHASVRYNGETHFTHGTQAELEESLRENCVKLEIAPTAAALPEGTQPPEGITLEVVNNNVLETIKILRRFESYEKKSDKDKAPKGGKKGDAEVKSEIGLQPQEPSTPEKEEAPPPSEGAPTAEPPAPSEG
jgi:hypothetical protein